MHEDVLGPFVALTAFDKKVLHFLYNIHFDHGRRGFDPSFRTLM
jgi:hypothetical protein